jgi:hypothetical protein
MPGRSIARRMSDQRAVVSSAERPTIDWAACWMRCSSAWAWARENANVQPIPVTPPAVVTSVRTRYAASKSLVAVRSTFAKGTATHRVNTSVIAVSAANELICSPPDARDRRYQGVQDSRVKACEIDAANSIAAPWWGTPCTVAFDIPPKTLRSALNLVSSLSYISMGCWILSRAHQRLHRHCSDRSRSPRRVRRLYDHVGRRIFQDHPALAIGVGRIRAMPWLDSHNAQSNSA